MLSEREMTEKQIHISPEGTEERIEVEHTFMMTLTEGGKLRVYHKGEPVSIHETREEANKGLGFIMGMTAGLIADPKGTVERLLDSLGKKDDGA